MKWFLVIVLLAGRALLLAEDPAVSRNARPEARAPQAPQTWLGLEVSRPDASITVHLPALPPGIGFVIRSITEGGPAEAAGLREFDLLWKMDDQMLVNEGQLAALLRLFKPGDEIALSGFRAGKAIEVKLKLGEAPATKRPFPNGLVDSAVLPGGECGVPMRVFNVSEKIASYSTDEGRVRVWRNGEAYQVKIEGPEDQSIYEGALPKGGGLEQIPDVWKLRVDALRRGLDQALDGRMMPTRMPRPRVVPPPSRKP